MATSKARSISNYHKIRGQTVHRESFRNWRKKQYRRCKKYERIQKEYHTGNIWKEYQRWPWDDLEMTLRWSSQKWSKLILNDREWSRPVKNWSRNKIVKILFDQFWTIFDQLLISFDRFWTNPILTNFGQSSNNFWPFSTNFQPVIRKEEKMWRKNLAAQAQKKKNDPFNEFPPFLTSFDHFRTIFNHFSSSARPISNHFQWLKLFRPAFK
jgi:hypothetical protein